MKKLGLLIAALVALVPALSQAEVFVWKDPQFDIKVTYPDNWMRQAQLDDDLRLFVLAPQGMDHAACRLYVTHDGRFMDAPAYAGQSVSSFVFDGEAIKREIYARPDTDMVRLATYTGAGTLGRGAAVTAEVDFQKHWAGGSYPMRALVLASQYHGDRIVMTCETLASAWPKWDTVMRNIMKSVDFPSAFASTPNGLYRPFQYDGDVILPLNRRSDGVTFR